MLAIATANPDAPAETYVRQHIRSLLPGRTVALYFQGDGESLKGIPSLRIGRDCTSHAALGRFRSFRNLVTYAYPGAVTGYTASKTIQFLRENQVRVILAEFGPTGCALLPICRLMGIKLIVNFHGYDATVMPKRWVIRHAYRYLNKYAEGFVCGSNHFSRVLENIGFERRKIHVIPCGIEVDKFPKDTQNDSNLLIAVGRFTEKKAPHLTIQAFSKVKRDFPDVRLEMIGGGALMPKCQQLIKSIGLENSITLHGVQNHDFVKQRLARASIFLQHSVTAKNGDTESQGISLLEAMASGIPVVSTLHNGFAETVIDNKTGFLVKEGDVEAMAKKISILIRDRSLRESMGKASFNHVRTAYSANLQTGKLQSLLNVS